MRKVIVASVFMFVICVAQANADGQVELFAGYLNPGEVNLNNVRTGLNLRGTSLYGVRAEFDFAKILGVEEDIAFSPRLFNSTLFPGGGSAADVRGFLYSTNFLLNIPLLLFL